MTEKKKNKVSEDKLKKVTGGTMSVTKREVPSQREIQPIADKRDESYQIIADILKNRP